MHRAWARLRHGQGSQNLVRCARLCDQAALDRLTHGWSERLSQLRNRVLEDAFPRARRPRLRSPPGAVTPESVGAEVKDNVLDLLIYLFENYMSADDEPRPDRETLKSRVGQGRVRGARTSSGPWSGWTASPASSSARSPRPRRSAVRVFSAARKLLRLGHRRARLPDVSGERASILSSTQNASW